MKVPAYYVGPRGIKYKLVEHRGEYCFIIPAFNNLHKGGVLKPVGVPQDVFKRFYRFCLCSAPRTLEVPTLWPHTPLLPPVPPWDTPRTSA